MSTKDARVTELAVEHGNAVLNYLHRRCDPREDAADIFQAVLLTVWRKIDTAPPDGEAKAWMIGIARHELSNHRRASQRRVAATERLRAALVDDPLAPSQGTHEDHVRQAVEGLPPRDREVVQLTYWEGLNSDEVSMVIGISPAAVRKVLQRARAKLARSILGASITAPATVPASPAPL